MDGVNRVLSSATFDLDHEKPESDNAGNEPSTLPWIQLGILGTFVAGLNVVFGQMILGLTNPPNVFGGRMLVSPPVENVLSTSWLERYSFRKCLMSNYLRIFKYHRY